MRITVNCWLGTGKDSLLHIVACRPTGAVISPHLPQCISPWVTVERQSKTLSLDINLCSLNLSDWLQRLPFTPDVVDFLSSHSSCTENIPKFVDNRTHSDSSKETKVVIQWFSSSRDVPGFNNAVSLWEVWRWGSMEWMWRLECQTRQPFRFDLPPPVVILWLLGAVGQSEFSTLCYVTKWHGKPLCTLQNHPFNSWARSSKRSLLAALFHQAAPRGGFLFSVKLEVNCGSTLLFTLNTPWFHLKAAETPHN